MICPYCRKEIKNTAKFCNYCGKPVSQSADIVPAAQNFPVEPRPAETKKKKRGGAGKWVLLILVLLAVAGGAFYGLVGKGIIVFNDDALFVDFVGDTQTTAVQTDIVPGQSPDVGPVVWVSVVEKETYHGKQGIKSWSEYTYDANGNLLTLTEYDSDGSAKETCVYTYDDMDNMLSEKLYNDEGAIEEWYEYTYDSDNNLIVASRLRDSGEVSYEAQYTYDEKGNILTKETSRGYKYEYSYDINGNLLTEKLCDDAGLFDYKYVYSYDNAGRVLKETDYNGSDVIQSWTEYSYDNVGNLVACTEYTYEVGATEASVALRYEYTYDEDCNLQSEVCRNGINGLVSWYEYTYDDSGYMCEKIKLDANKMIECRYEYAYDRNGNETMCIKYDSNDEVAKKCERVYAEIAVPATSAVARKQEEAEQSLSEEDPATTIPEETTTVWLLTSITEDGSNITYSFDYDSRGNLVSMVRDGDDSEIRYEYSVGSNDEILESVTYIRGEKGPSTKYSYDSNGNVTEERRFSSDGTTVVACSKYSYDNAGNNIETMHYLKDGTVAAQCIYSYNPEGQIIKSESFGSFYDWSEYSYSTDGLLVKCTNYEEDGTLLSWYEYSFDKDGNLLEYSEYDDDGTKWFWCRYVYDSWGNMISVKDYNSDGSVNDETTLTYTEMQIPVDSKCAGMSSLERLTRIKAEGLVQLIYVAGIDYY